MRNNPSDSDQKASALLRIVLLVFGGQILILYITNLLLVSSSSVFGTFYQGLDYVYFHNGAQAWLAGRDPYRVSGFVTPPISLVIPSLFAHLSLHRATLVFLGCNLILVPLAFWWYSGALQLRLQQRVLLLTAATLFVSAQESIRGGNMDALMLALLIAAFGLRQPLAGAVSLAASITLKAYSVILIPVAIRHRQWRFAAFTLAAIPVLLLPFHRVWPSALHALVGRDARYSCVSIAPATLIYACTGTLDHRARSLCFAFWAITFAIALYRDHEPELSPRTLARYVPWMLALPALVFSYVGILALTVLASLVATARIRPLRRSEYCSFIGFLLLGIRIEQVTNRLPLGYDTYLFFRTHAAVLQSFGVVMMMIGMCLSPSAETGEGETLHETGEDAAIAGQSLPDRSPEKISLA